MSAYPEPPSMNTEKLKGSSRRANLNPREIENSEFSLTKIDRVVARRKPVMPDVTAALSGIGRSNRQRTPPGIGPIVTPLVGSSRLENNFDTKSRASGSRIFWGSKLK